MAWYYLRRWKKALETTILKKMNVKVLKNIEFLKQRKNTLQEQVAEKNEEYEQQVKQEREKPKRQKMILRWRDKERGNWNE